MYTYLFLCRYPKPGRTNPFVNAFVTRLDRLRRGSPTPLLLAPPKYFDDKERLIYSVTWATNEELSLTWETRHQNYSLVSICDTLANCRDSLVKMHSRQCKYIYKKYLVHNMYVRSNFTKIFASKLLPKSMRKYYASFLNTNDIIKKS